MAAVAPVQAFPDPETGAGAKLQPGQGAAVIGASKTKLDPRRALAQFRKKDPNAQGSVRLDTLPPNLRAVVSEFDDGDGEINLTELAATLSALQSSRKSAKHYARLACVGGIAGLVAMLIILGLTFLSVKLATPTGVEGGSLVVAGTNDPVRVASAEFEVKDGSMKQRDGTAVTTAQASVPQKLDSQLPDSYFNELRFIELKSPNGANLHLDVTARARVPKKISAHGNIIQLITPVGTLTLDGEIMSFDDKTAPLLEAAGFELHSESTSSGRRLAAGHDVVGWFNTFAKLTEDLLDVPQSATFPEGDHSYVMTRYEKCGEECYAAEETNSPLPSDASEEASPAAADTYNPNPNGFCPTLTADAERDGKAILYGAVTINGVDYRKETVTTQVKTVNGVAVTRTSTLLDRFPGHVLVELAAGSEARTFQTYGGAMYRCADPNAEDDNSSDSSEEEAASTATEAEIQAELLNPGEAKVSIAYEGAATLPGHTGELRKYTMTTTAALAVATGMGKVIIYDDTASPVRLEIPGAGVIVDISNVQTAPDMDDALFELPTCPTGTTANPTPNMKSGGIGGCVEEDAEDPWDASEVIDEGDGGDFGDETTSGTLRRLSDLEGLDAASLGKLARELNDEQHGARSLATGRIREYRNARVAWVAYANSLCFGHAIQWRSRSDIVELRMICNGTLYDGEVRVTGKVRIVFHPGTEVARYYVPYFGRVKDMMTVEVKTTSAVNIALKRIQQEQEVNTTPSAKFWLNRLVRWSDYWANTAPHRSWRWSTTSRAHHRMQHNRMMVGRCARFMYGRVHMPANLVHSASSGRYFLLRKMWGWRWYDDRIRIDTDVSFTNLNKCWTNLEGAGITGNTGIVTTVVSRIYFHINIGKLKLMKSVYVQARYPQGPYSGLRGCWSRQADDNVALATTLAFHEEHPQMMTTGPEQCNPRYSTDDASQAAFNSKDLGTTIDFYFNGHTG